MGQERLGGGEFKYKYMSIRGKTSLIAMEELVMEESAFSLVFTIPLNKRKKLIYMIQTGKKPSIMLRVK
jgi:hypothetical protein